MTYQNPTASSLPTAGAPYRGRTFVVQGSTGVADGLYVCVKTASDTYTWVNMSQASAINIDTLAQDLKGEETTSLVTVNRRAALGLASYSSGQMGVTYFTALKDLTISKLGIGSSGAATGTGTLCRIGLFTAASDDALTLVAATANDATLLASANTFYERALSTGGSLPATYTLSAGVRYACGVLGVGFTTWVVTGISGNNASVALARKQCGVVSGLSDLPASVTAASVNTDGRSPFVRLAQ